MPLLVSCVEVALSRKPCRTRLPFRFGAVTVTAADLLTCRVRVRDDSGNEAQGWSADLLVPRWFRKDTVATPGEDADELFASAEAAANSHVVRAGRSMSAFALWRDVFDECVSSQGVGAADLLVRGFGVALLERAVIDGVCRLHQRPFVAALREDLFGFDPGRVHPELAAWQWQRELPTPAPRLAVRHTVGMLDVLRAGDLLPDRRLDDGLPQTLDQDIAAYGLTWFKVKIGAGHDQDVQRLLDLATFFGEIDLAPGLTLDGNEQFHGLAQLADVLDAVAEQSRGRELLRRLQCIEQPLPRALTFEPERHGAIARVTKFAPLMLDEADAMPQSFPRALELGYRGVSVKNCKGVFRALCNFGLCRRGDGRFQSGEDLTNIGVLPLQQDLVTAAALGLPHVERNGHHYFRGLDHLPTGLVARAAAAHPDLYRSLGNGASLRVAAGQVDLTSVLAAPGYGHALDGHAEGLRIVASR